MSSNGKSGFGTSFSWNSQTVADILDVNNPSMKADSIEITNQDSPDGFKEFMAGLRDGGEVKFDLNFYPGDTNGQYAMVTDFQAGTSRTAVITLPTSIAASFTFTGFITSFESKSPVNDRATASVTIKISGKPILAVTASTGLTTPFFSISESAVITPAAANAVYDYVATVLTGITSVTVTPTATAGTITVNGSTVSTGVPSSAITLGVAGSNTTVTIVVTESGKMPKTYTIRVARATS